jgi:signal transduction histidine kinase
MYPHNHHSGGKRSYAIAPTDEQDDLNSASELTQFYNFLQEQIKQLASHLSLTEVWLAFCSTPHRNSTRILQYCSQTHTFSWLPTQVLEAYQVCDTTSPVFQVTEISVSAEEQHLKTYICFYDLHSTGFLLLKTTASLSPIQRYCIEQQTHLIQQKLDVTWQQERHQEQIQILEQTIHRVEHQLRNPLALIQLYADVLAKELSSENFGEQAKQICKAVHRIQNQLTQVVQYSQSSNLKLETHSLDTLFSEVIEEFHPLAAKKSIQFHCNGVSVMIRADRWQLKEALTNVMENALHFSPTGETIICQWQVFHSEIFMEICDKGPGFSAPDLKNVFKPFYSRRPGGTGLGLTIAQKIVLGHQGCLWAENLPAGGARLCIVLPRTLR